MTSLCGHVKALIREWAMERMAEKHQNEDGISVFVCVFLLIKALLSLSIIMNQLTFVCKRLGTLGQITYLIEL